MYMYMYSSQFLNKDFPVDSNPFTSHYLHVHVHVYFVHVYLIYTHVHMYMYIINNMYIVHVHVVHYAILLHCNNHIA